MQDLCPRIVGGRVLDAQEHAGENIGDTASRSIVVELKESEADLGHN